MCVCVGVNTSQGSCLSSLSAFESCPGYEGFKKRSQIITLLTLTGVAPGFLSVTEKSVLCQGRREKRSHDLAEKPKLLSFVLGRNQKQVSSVADVLSLSIDVRFVQIEKKKRSPKKVCISPFVVAWMDIFLRKKIYI